MTEQEIRKRIKELERVPPLKETCPYQPYNREGLHYDPFYANPVCSDCVADRILALIKEAGYMKLAEDQTLPTNPYTGHEANVYSIAQHEMICKGWRKVEKGDKTNE